MSNINGGRKDGVPIRFSAKFGQRAHTALRDLATLIGRSYDKTGEIVITTVCEAIITELKNQSTDPEMAAALKNPERLIEEIQKTLPIVRQKLDAEKKDDALL